MPEQFPIAGLSGTRSPSTSSRLTFNESSFNHPDRDSPENKQTVIFIVWSPQFDVSKTHQVIGLQNESDENRGLSVGLLESFLIARD